MLKFMLPAMLSAGFAIPVADGPPTLKFEQGCREAAAMDPLKLTTVDICMKQENEAREEATKTWTTFSAADRMHCLSLTNIGGMPSYVELITCLQMSRDARLLRQQPPKTEGMNAIPDISRVR